MKKTLIIMLSLAWTGVLCAAGSPMHPSIPLLDRAGHNVLDSGEPVSTMTTCGKCHDTEYIASHSYHVGLGRDETVIPGTLPGGRAWDSGAGPFGRWDPLTYRVLGVPGEKNFDLGTPDWVRLAGARLVGGGPAEYSRDSVRLEDKTFAPGNPEGSVRDQSTGETRAWDWKKSGGLEMDCFLCHIQGPAFGERAAEIGKGDFRGAPTATLAGSGLVRLEDGVWKWQRSEFTPEGLVTGERLGLQSPKSENCAGCHARVHYGNDPVTLAEDLDETSSLTTGQLWSPQRIAEGGINAAGRDSLDRPWDVHAERLLECSGCHYSLNNPAYYREDDKTRPYHLEFDARKKDIGEYLKRPSHELAKGESEAHSFAQNLDGSMRRCEDCHSRETSLHWDPFSRRHLETLSCEACHIPQVNTPALSAVDWTVLTPKGGARLEYRGVRGGRITPDAYVTGYEPVLLPRRETDGRLRLFPYNMVSAWYWVSGNPSAPVRLDKLEKAFFGPGGRYSPGILAALDSDGDGKISEPELRLDSPAKVAAVEARLEAVGVESPHIEAEVQPWGVHHNVAPASYATRSCSSCHDGGSRMSQPFHLAAFLPGGVVPSPVGRTNVLFDGKFVATGVGLDFAPTDGAEALYVPGQDRSGWIDSLGWLSIIGVLAGVLVHGSLRIGKCCVRKEK